MINQDTRRLKAEAQEALRKHVVAAVRGGMRKSDAARTFGVSRTSIDRWLEKFRRGGERRLRSRKRGPKGGIRLAPLEAAQTVRWIVDRSPDQLKMPFALWTRQAVAELIEAKFGLVLSPTTVGRYLKRWGLTPQKPLRKAFEQDPLAVRRWLAEEYPAIRAQARWEKAEIHWGDEMGMRSDHQAGRSYGRRGQTPVIAGTGRRFRCHLLSTITNRGTLRFMVFKERFSAEVFVNFLRRLIRSAPRRIFLIVDRHPVHRSGAVRRWLQEQRHRIRLFFLPAYSPELNPDELLNQDVKTNAVGRCRPPTLAHMIGAVRTYLRSTQNHPDIVRAYFHAPSVHYAAT
jgi:transposase